MISYLEHSSEFIFDPPFLQPPDFPPHHILELGSGTGIVASRLVQHIRHAQGFFTVTDLPEVCPLLERNLTNYIQGSPSRTTLLVRPLAWGNKAHALAIYEELLSSSSKKFGTAPILSHIICSDLVGVFLPFLSNGLAETSSISLVRASRIIRASRDTFSSSQRCDRHPQSRHLTSVDILTLSFTGIFPRTPSTPSPILASSYVPSVHNRHYEPAHRHHLLQNPKFGERDGLLVYFWSLVHLRTRA